MGSDVWFQLAANVTYRCKFRTSLTYRLMIILYIWKLQDDKCFSVELEFYFFACLYQTTIWKNMQGEIYRNFCAMTRDMKHKKNCYFTILFLYHLLPKYQVDIGKCRRIFRKFHSFELKFKYLLCLYLDSRLEYLISILQLTRYQCSCKTLIYSRHIGHWILGTFQISVN